MRKEVNLLKYKHKIKINIKCMSTSAKDTPSAPKTSNPVAAVKTPLKRTSAAITKSNITIKGGKNLRFTMGSPLLGLLGMQLVAIGLYLGKKLPILGFVGKILHYYFGKTSFWSILVLSRKAFITLNAIIGVFFILKLTGLDITTILSNYSILGNTYLEILQGLIKNSFN